MLYLISSISPKIKKTLYLLLEHKHSCQEGHYVKVMHKSDAIDYKGVSIGYN